MSNALPNPWCFVFQSKQRYPMSILISVKGCGLSGNQPWFYSLVSDFSRSENICNQLRSKMTSMQGGFTFYMDYGCLISKGRLMMHIFNGGVHVTQSKQFQGSACYGNLGLYCLIFWSTKLILKWPLKLHKKNKIQPYQRSWNATLELGGGTKEICARISKQRLRVFSYKMIAGKKA